MNLLNKYKLKKRIFALGSLVWDTLSNFSVLLIIIFLVITAITYWQGIALSLLAEGIDITRQINQMFLIIGITSMIIVINYLKNLISILKKPIWSK